MRNRRLARSWSQWATMLGMLALACALALAGCGRVTWDDVASLTATDEATEVEEDNRDEVADQTVAEQDAQTPAPTEDEPDASSGNDAITDDGIGGQDIDSPDMANAPPAANDAAKSSAPAAAIDEAGTYTSKDDVALYLHTYGHLPSNYVTKEEAEDAGWKTEGLSLAEACPGKSIGGDRFGNREGRLPTAKGRTWKECDIDYEGTRSRNAKRLVYSNDGLVYYTDDHYQTFERLY